MGALLRKTFRDLRSSRAQSLALITLVALGVASFIALVGAYRDLSTSYNRTYTRLKFADVTFSLTAAPESILQEIAGIPGVAAVSGRLILDAGLELPGGEPIRSRLIGLPPDRRPAVNDLHIHEGRYLNPDDRRSAVLEAHFAEFYGLHPGDSVTPIINGEKIPFKVVGVAASPEYLIVSPSRQDILPSARTFAVLFVPLPELQKLLGSEGQINNIAVLIEPGADRESAVGAIASRLKGFGLASVTPQEDQPSNAALRMDLEGFREWADLMPGLILIVAAMSVYIMLSRVVRVQRAQIGLMKALGYTSRAVMGHYLTSALIIGITGSALGIIGGLPLAGWITGSYAAELGIPMVETHVYPDLVLGGVLLSLFFCALAGLGPAYASARMAPAAAMHLDPGAALVKGGSSLIERLVSLPLWLRLSVRNIFRVRHRSIGTGLGIVFAFVLVLMSWGMIDSMNYLLRHNFEDIERWDTVALFDSPQTEDVLKEVEGWKGVRKVEPFVQFPAVLKGPRGREEVVITALDPSATLHVLQLSGKSDPGQALTPGNIVLTSVILDKLNVGIGDPLMVETPLGPRRFKIGGISEELTGPVAYINIEDAIRAAGRPVFNGLYLEVDPRRAGDIKSALYHLPGAASVQLKKDIEHDWREMLGLFYVFMGVVMAFAVAMAFALLFNATTISVLERQREFATMRAVGAGRGYIALLIAAELIGLWLIALIPGLLLGKWVAVQMGAAYTTDLFSFRVIIAPTSYIITAAGILLTILLSAFPAVRRVNRLNLAEATKILA